MNQPSPILPVSELARVENITYSIVWHACKYGGLPHGYLSKPRERHKRKAVVAVADWHWWKVRNVRNISAREIAK